MDSQLCGRVTLCVSILICSASPALSRGLEYLQNNAVAVPPTDGNPYHDFLDDSDSGSYSDLDDTMSMQESWYPRTHHLETRRRFLTSKRGWDVIEKIWQPQFPKRAWEFVDRVWKIPKLRKKYLRYLHPNKRSSESVADIPVQPQKRSDFPSSSDDYVPDIDESQVNGMVTREQLADLAENAWSILKVVKGLLRRCCEPGQTETECKEACF